jgi:hypothetical protein
MALGGVGNKFCPICGMTVPKGMSVVAVPGGNYPQHRCAEATLRAIDATRQVDDRQPASPTFGQRLLQGFELLNDEDTENPEQ